MKIIEAAGRVDAEGKLKISSDDMPVFLNQISKIPNKSVRIRVTVEGKRRSQYQNNYYYGVVVELIRSALTEEWGELMTKDEVHEILKQNCNWREKVNESTGETLKVPHTTTDMTTVEFEEYLERCRRFALEWFKIEIPLPNEQTELKLQ